MKGKRALLTFLVASTAMSAISSQTSAVYATATSDFEMEEIIVSARKRSESLQDVSESITALQGTALEKIGAQGFADYYRFVPSLQFTDRGPGRNNIVIRGISTNAEGGVSTSSVYFDEVPVTEAGSNPNLHMFDVERVEVLRGPQGTLYGSGAIGGTIRVVTTPADTNEWEVKTDLSLSLTEGGEPNYSANAAVNVPIVEDKLGIRLVGYHLDEGGYIDNIDPVAGDDNIGDVVTTGGRFSATLNLGENLRVRPSIIYQKKESDGLPEDELYYGRFQQSRAVEESLSSKIQLYGLTIDYDISDWATLTSATSYTVRNQNDVYLEPPEFFPDEINSNPISYYTFDKYKSLSQELRMASTGDGPIDWIFGIYYNSHKNVDTFIEKGDGSGQLSADAIANLGLDPEDYGLGLDGYSTGGGSVRNKQYSAFGEVGFYPLEKLKVTGGFRYYEVKMNADGRYRTIFDWSGRRAPSDGKNTGFNPKVNIAYEASEDVLIYAQAAKGFRRGSPAPLLTDPCQRAFDEEGKEYPGDVTSDNLWNYEVGMKGTFADGRLSVNASAYYIDWSDIQAYVTYYRAANQNTGAQECLARYAANAGKASIRGLELEMTGLVTEDWQLALSGSYTDGKLDEDIPALGFEKGQNVPAIPKWKFSVSSDLSFRLGDLGEGYFNANLAYEGKAQSYFYDAPNSEFGDYAIANSRIGIIRDNWEISAYVNNVFNTYAATYISFSGWYNAISGDNPAVGRPRPRTFGLNYKANF